MKQILPESINIAISREGGQPLVQLSGRRTGIETTDGEVLPDQTYSKPLSGDPEFDILTADYLSACYARLKAVEGNTSVSVRRTVTEMIEVL